MKINFCKGEASLLNNGKETDNVKKFFFKQSNFKFYVCFNKIGNFCSINNLYVPLNVNSWDLNLDRFLK